MKKRLVVLGSTGSIGTQTLELVREHPSQLEVIGLAAKSNADLLLQQAAEFHVKNFALFDSELENSLGSGVNGLVELSELPNADVIVMAVSGAIGLKPSLAALHAGKRLALASKEVLVMAGQEVMRIAGGAGEKLTPIDSEHSAIFQCLQGVPKGLLKEVILTASGGPFHGKSIKDLENVSLQDALNHPTWKMGGKITIDSATLMNKALEWIEAKWLFSLQPSQLDAVVHRQSIVHSLIKTSDGSVLAQMGWPNMKLPILYSLTFPDRIQNKLAPWNPIDSPHLTFEPIDHKTFPSLQMAKVAMEKGGAACAIFNAANECLVGLFLQEKIRFLDIFRGVEWVCSHVEEEGSTIECLTNADREARLKAQEWSELHK